jgi:hypothetical protein
MPVSKINANGALTVFGVHLPLSGAKPQAVAHADGADDHPSALSAASQKHIGSTGRAAGIVMRCRASSSRSSSISAPVSTGRGIYWRGVECR